MCTTTPWIQADNYTELSRSPVLVRSRKPKQMVAYPLVHLRVRRRTDLASTASAGVSSFYEYISVMCLGLDVDLDAPTILIYLADFNAGMHARPSLLCSCATLANPVCLCRPPHRSTTSLTDTTLGPSTLTITLTQMW